MHIHLTHYDIASLRKEAATSARLSDDGEAFAEEALGCFSEEQLDAIERSYGGSAEEFFLQVYEAWDEEDPDDLVPVLIDALAEVDVELTFDDAEADEDYEDEIDWEDDDAAIEGDEGIEGL